MLVSGLLNGLVIYCGCAVLYVIVLVLLMESECSFRTVHVVLHCVAVIDSSAC